MLVPDFQYHEDWYWHTPRVFNIEPRAVSAGNIITVEGRYADMLTVSEHAKPFSTARALFLHTSFQFRLEDSRDLSGLRDESLILAIISLQI